jgi:peroxiredoxin
MSSLGFGQTAGSANPAGENKVEAPVFTVTSLKGKRLELAALRGKIVVLNFWFTGCEPCVAEFAQLNALVTEFKRKEVVFIALTPDSAATLKPFLKEHRFKYQVAPNAIKIIVSTYRDGSGSVVFPTHIVIDKEGKIDTRLVGAEGVTDLRNAIARLASQ